MAVTFKSASTPTYVENVSPTVSKTLTLDFPADWAAGDFAVLTLANGVGTSPTITGWTLIANQNSLSMYYRFLQAGDTAPSVTQSLNNQAVAGNITLYTGVDTVEPITITPIKGSDAYAASGFGDSGAILGPSGIATAYPNQVVIVGWSSSSSDNSSTAWTAPSGWTLRSQISRYPFNNTNGVASYMLTDVTIASASTVARPTGTFANGWSGTGYYVGFTLTPAPATPFNLTYRGVGTIPTFSSSSSLVSHSLTPGLPAGWQPGDGAIMFVGWAGNAVSTPPSINQDWKLVADNAMFTGSQRYAVYYRRLQAGDTAPTVSWGNQALSNIMAAIIAYGGVNNSEIPFQAVIQGTTFSNSGAGTLAVFPSITTKWPNTYALLFNEAFWASNFGTPTGWTELFDQTNGGGFSSQYQGMAVDHKPVTNPATVTPPGIYASNSGNHGYMLLGLVSDQGPDTIGDVEAVTTKATFAATGNAPMIGTLAVSTAKATMAASGFHAPTATMAASTAKAVMTASGTVPTWSVVGQGTVTTVLNGNITLPIPAGVQANDILVAHVAFRSNVAFTIPSDWTLMRQEIGGNTTANSTGSIASGFTAYCIRGTTDPSNVFTRSGGDVAFGNIVAYRFGWPGLPKYRGITVANMGTASTTITLGTMTTIDANTLIIGTVFGARNTTYNAFRSTDLTTSGTTAVTTGISQPNAWTLRYSGGTASGADTGLGIADVIKTTAGTTGSIQATAGTSARHYITASMFAPPPFDVGNPAGDMATSWSASFAGTGTTPVLTTLDPSWRGSIITLSNGNLTATATGNGTNANYNVRSTFTKTGKMAFEATINQVGYWQSIGFLNANFPSNYWLGSSNDGIGWSITEQRFYMNGSYWSGMPSVSNGDVIQMLFDLTAKWFFLRLNGGSWWGRDASNNYVMYSNTDIASGNALGLDFDPWGGGTVSQVPYFVGWNYWPSTGTSTGQATFNFGNPTSGSYPAGYEPFNDVPASAQNNFYVKHNGVWKQNDQLVKHSGSWKPANETWVKHNGTWKKV